VLAEIAIVMEFHPFSVCHAGLFLVVAQRGVPGKGVQ
jgi:hypothetical protein